MQLVQWFGGSFILKPSCGFPKLDYKTRKADYKISLFFQSAFLLLHCRLLAQPSRIFCIFPPFPPVILLFFIIALIWSDLILGDKKRHLILGNKDLWVFFPLLARQQFFGKSFIFHYFRIAIPLKSLAIYLFFSLTFFSYDIIFNSICTLYGL